MIDFPAKNRPGYYVLLRPDGERISARYIQPHNFWRFPNDDVEYETGYLRGEGWKISEYLGMSAVGAANARNRDVALDK